MSIDVKAAGPGEKAQVVDVILLAFAQDPVVRWAFPDPNDYVTAFRDFIPAFGGRAFDHGSALHASDFSGGALWLPPGVGPDEETLVGIIESRVAPERLQTFFGIFEQMDKFHPEEPLWYLPLIGVDPFHQGRGVGSAIMRAALDRVDQDHSDAYLESSNPKNIPLYERFGFEIVGTIQVGDAPPIWPMRRPAR